MTVLNYCRSRPWHKYAVTFCLVSLLALAYHRSLLVKKMQTNFIIQFIANTTKMNSLLPNTGIQSTCCRSSENPKDICNRKNCTMQCPLTKPSILELENGEPKRLDHNIGFFIETSKRGGLNFRQGCAVESLAYHNPNMTIYVLFIDASINKSFITVNQLSEKYKNIRLVSVNLEDYVTGTPLEHWYHCNDWRKGPFHVSHLSDGLRFLTLAKYGGYYFDLDVIQVRPVTYYRNFVALETATALGSSALHADYGNPVMSLAVEDFPTNYLANNWAHNGPDLLVRVMKKWCQTEKVQSMNYTRCRGFHVLPQTSFSPVPFDNWGEPFADRPSNETDDKLPWITDQVIGIHLWNKLSYNRTIYKNSTQYYNRLARPSCPVIYSIAPDTF